MPLNSRPWHVVQQVSRSLLALITGGTYGVSVGLMNSTLNFIDGHQIVAMRWPAPARFSSSCSFSKPPAGDFIGFYVRAYIATITSQMDAARARAEVERGTSLPD